MNYIPKKNNQRKEVWLIQWRKKSSMLEPGIADLSDLNSVSFQTAYWLRLGHTNEYHFLLIWKWVVRISKIVLFYPQACLTHSSHIIFFFPKRYGEGCSIIEEILISRASSSNWFFHLVEYMLNNEMHFCSEMKRVLLAIVKLVFINSYFIY